MLIFAVAIFYVSGPCFAGLVIEDDFSTAEEARAFESRIIQLIDDTRGAVVGVEILVRDQRGRMVGVAGGSGAIIDADDGIILTAGHVGRAAKLPVRVYLDDGSMLPAVTLGQHLDGQEDCGLIKIEPEALTKLPEGTLQALPLGDSKQVEVGDWVVTYGHALGIEKEPWRPPPARIGRITGNHGHVITMDAPLNSGDSGGPLIDLDGFLIGINESCAGHPFENAATTVQIAIDRMDGMLRGESTGATLPSAEEGYVLDPNGPSTRPIIFDAANEFGGRNAEEVRSVFADSVWDAADWTVRVFKDGEQIALGLIVDAAGLVVTKASEIDPRQERIMVGTATGLLEEAVPIGRDPKLDLLLLRLPLGDWTPVPLSEAGVTEAGAWVVTAGPDAEPISFGICELDQYDSGLSMLDRAFLGVQVQRARRDEVGATVQRLVAGGAARRAGLQPNDVILSINDSEIRGPSGLIDVLADYRASDIVTITYQRGDSEFDSTVRLGSRVYRPVPDIQMMIEHESGNQVVPVSRRDTGFGQVIQHDSLVRPEQCGGPLVDLDGRFIGMNIARSDRTKTFAIPASELQASLERMLGHEKMEKAWLAVDPRVLQVPIQPDENGVYLLQASDAQLFGPAAYYMEDDSRGHIGNWLSARDEVLWVIDSPEPGAYQVEVNHASENERGGRYAVVSNRDSVEATVRTSRSDRDFRSVDIGDIEIAAGDSVIIMVEPLEEPPLSLMNLRSVRLTPIVD